MRYNPLMTSDVGTAPHSLHIDATVLPDGVRRDLFVVGGRISFEPVDDAVTVSSGGYAIPGLVDAHAHLALNSPAGDGVRVRDGIRASARAQLDAGVLLVREPGSPTRETRDLGPHEGLPRVQTAGRFLAAPGRYFPNLAREVTPDELPDAVADEVAWSGHWAKVIGDFFDDDGTITPTFPTEALAAAAGAAHAAGARITMHCMTPRAIEQALEAAFDGIEHGTAITDELVDELAARDITWVPTLSILQPARSMLTERPAADTKALLESFDRHPTMVRHAARAGVTVLAGTDAGVVPHGVVGGEIRLLEAAGLPTRDALAAGSWEARRYLGLPLVEHFAPADLVVYPDDPSEDLSVLAHPSLIVLDGTVVTGRRPPRPT